MIFDNLTFDAAAVRFHFGPRTEPKAVGHHRNSNVPKILPVTTLRTIDLGGKKNPGPLFSIFWRRNESFFEANYAPKYPDGHPTLTSNSHPNMGKRRAGRGQGRPLLIYTSGSYTSGEAWMYARIIRTS